MALDNLPTLLEEQLKDLYSAENQLFKALPKMAGKASTKALKTAFTSHTKQTQGHIKRLDQIAKKLKIDLGGKTCKAMEGLIKEGDEVISETGEGIIIDAALIAAAQRVEHYEISAYGTARALAKELKHREVVAILNKTLKEESDTDKKLSQICVGNVFKAAARLKINKKPKEEEKGFLEKLIS